MLGPAHLNYVFHIFHRLNTGGLKLKNPEIRNCIFGGSLNRLLRKLDLVPEWRRINRMKPDNNYRFVKQELILRFFAFLFQERDYRGEMANFLNDFMEEHRDEDEEILQKWGRLFADVVGIFSGIFDHEAPKAAIPSNVIYAVMVGMARNIDGLRDKAASEIKVRYEQLLRDEAFADRASLDKVSIVHGRLQAAERIFGDPA